MNVLRILVWSAGVAVGIAGCVWVFAQVPPEARSGLRLPLAPLSSAFHDTVRAALRAAGLVPQSSQS